MAASLFLKLLRNQSQPSIATRLIISHLTTTTSSTTTVTATHQPPVTTPPIKTHFLTQPKSQGSNLFNPTHLSHIYPSFSFGYFLNPASLAGFCGSDDADGVVLRVAEEDWRTIWADSVKKKRKRKMNKHKLKKLRKSLRRKT